MRFQPGSRQLHLQGFSVADMAAFIACSVLLSLGCLIGLKKSALFPSTAIRFLGCNSDSLKQAFICHRISAQSFADLRASLLTHKSVSLRNLQKFTAITTSFALLLPG